jgi:2-polyprenyl-6-methoxyphenol hydroxylase-like FAD-dependent oxidoreductase
MSTPTTGTGTGGVRRDLKIVIVGGGIAGCALGLGLQNQGFTQVTIYERDDGFERREQGYGLTMLQGIKALKVLGWGLYEEVQALDTPSRSHYIFDSTGNIVSFFGTVFYPESDTPKKSTKKHNLHLSRQNLRNLLLSAYASATGTDIRWNHRLVALNEMQSMESDLPRTGMLGISKDKMQCIKYIIILILFSVLGIFIYV